MDFVLDQFKFNVLKNKNVSKIISTGKVVKIIFKDNFQLNVNVAFDEYHKFYTYMDYVSYDFHYIGDMPHDTYEDLYEEIKRMSTKDTRTNLCKSRYFKAY